MFTHLRFLPPDVVTASPQSWLCRTWLIAHWPTTGVHPFLTPPYHSFSYCFPSEINWDKIPCRNMYMEGSPLLLKWSNKPAVTGIVFLTANLSYFGCFPSEAWLTLVWFLEIVSFSIFINITNLRNNEHSPKVFSIIIS